VSEVVYKEEVVPKQEVEDENVIVKAEEHKALEKMKQIN
jgi:hypothetical protein